MASTNSDKTSEKSGNTAVPGVGDHDRVAMLSLNADGTPDQHDPEIIGDKAAAVAATREQYAQQAVSATDQRLIDVANTDAVEAQVGTQDSAVEALTAEHEKVAAAAEKAADATVRSLSRD